MTSAPVTVSPSTNSSFAQREWRPQVATFDPTPLHVRQVIDDADDRKQPPLRGPPQLLLRQPIRGGDDLFALPSDVAEKYFTFILARRWRPRYLEAHGTTLPSEEPQPPPSDTPPRMHPASPMCDRGHRRERRDCRVCALVAHRRTIRERSPEHFRAGHRFEQPRGFGTSALPARPSAGRMSEWCRRI